MVYFNEVISQLYSGSESHMRNMIRCVAMHRTLGVEKTGVIGVHTGCFFRTKTDTLMELIYDINSRELIYQAVFPYPDKDKIIRLIGQIMKTVPLKERDEYTNNVSFAYDYSPNDIIRNATQSSQIELPYYLYSSYDTVNNKFMDNIQRRLIDINSPLDKQLENIFFRFYNNAGILFEIPLCVIPPLIVCNP